MTTAAIEANSPVAEGVGALRLALTLGGVEECGGGECGVGERALFRFLGGHGGLVEVDTVLVDATAWLMMEESRSGEWCVHRFQGLVLAVRLTS